MSHHSRDGEEQQPNDDGGEREEVERARRRKSSSTRSGYSSIDSSTTGVDGLVVTERQENMLHKLGGMDGGNHFEGKTEERWGMQEQERWRGGGSVEVKAVEEELGALNLGVGGGATRAGPMSVVVAVWLPSLPDDWSHPLALFAATK